MGLAEGPATLFEWRWYYGYPSLWLWAMLAAVLIVPSANRNWRAWLILILPLMVAGFCYGLRAVTDTAPLGQLEPFYYILFVLSIAWASVWLLAPWLRAKRQINRVLLAVAVMTSVGALGHFAYFGSSFSTDDPGLWVFLWGTATVTLVGATAISGRCSDGPYCVLISMLWLVLWMPLLCFACIICVYAVMVAVMGDWTMLGAVLCASVPTAMIISLCLYLLNLPVMLTAQFSPLYRERFRALFCPFRSDKMVFPSAMAWPPDTSPDNWPTDAQEGESNEENNDEGESPFAAPPA